MWYDGVVTSGAMIYIRFGIRRTPDEYWIEGKCPGRDPQGWVYFYQRQEPQKVVGERRDVQRLEHDAHGPGPSRSAVARIAHPFRVRQQHPLFGRHGQDLDAKPRTAQVHAAFQVGPSWRDA